MKRILSALLAVMLIATLLPTAAFATEGEANTGITIRYDFGAFMNERAYRWNESGPWLTNFTYDNTNGLYKYAKSSIEQKEDDGSSISGNNYIAGTNRHNPYLTVSVASEDRYFQLGGNYYISFEIYVPVSGTYKMNVGYCECKDLDGVMSVYMNQGEKPELAWNYKISEYICTKGGDNRAFDLRKTLKGWDATEGKSLEKDLELELEKGHYLLTFKGTNYSYIKYVELVSGDGKGVAPVYAKSYIDTKLLNLDGQKNTKMRVNGVYLSTGAPADEDEYSVTFRSSNASVATVDAEGNVTAQGVGKADIIADVKIGDASFETKQGVSVEAKGIKVIYNLTADMAALGMNWGVDKSLYPLSLINYENTKNFYKLHESSREYEGDFIKYSGGIQLQYKGNNMANPAEYITFAINVPAAGTYDVDMHTVLAGNTALNTRPKVFFSSKGKSQADVDYVGDYNVYNENPPKEAQKLHIGKVVVDEPGEYFITFSLINNPGWTYTKISTFTLTSGTNNALINGNITSTADTINVDEGESATVAASGYLSSTAEATNAFTYTSSNPAVAEVDATSGVVTPKKAGKVTITATANDAVVTNTLTTDITVTENVPGEAADTTVKVYIPEVTGGTVTVSGATLGAVSDVDFGDPVTVEAVAAEGYKFAYWKDNRGGFVSEEEKHTFKPYTNTSLIAVFDSVDAESDTTGVEFFDGNKTYLGFKEVTAGITFGEIQDKPAHGLFGFAPNGWSIDESEEINSPVRAVALYSEQGNSVSGISVNGEAKTASYDDAIIETVKGAKTWYRDDKLVGYGETYTYLAWSGTAITSSEDDVAKHEPLAVLNKSGDAYMLEYDRGDCEIIEAGILFGNDTHKTVGSCYYKARVKNIKAHGQFTAKANAEGTAEMQSIARGYVIFKTSDGSIRVIYAD